MERARTKIMALGLAALVLSSSSRSFAFESQSRSASKPPAHAVAQLPDKSSVLLQQRQVARCTVPNLIGLNVNAASGSLEKARLSLGDVSRRVDSRPTGTVIDQSTKPDTLVPCGSRIGIELAIADDRPRFDCAVPELRGDEERSARREVIDAKLVVGRIDRRPDSRHPAGTVTEQSPRPGKPVRCGSSVDFSVVVRDEPPLCQVPSLLRLEVSSARRVVQDQRLRLGRIDTRRDDRTSGTIIDQSPEGGGLVACGSPVNVVVAAVPEVQRPCTVPGLLGADAQSVRNALGSARLTLGKTGSRQDTRPLGTVIEQWPEAGAQVACGSPVNVILADTPAPPSPPQPTPSLVVPPLTGIPRADALERIHTAGLSPGRI